MKPTKGWMPIRLGDHLQIKHGFAFKGEYFADEGPYIVLTPGNFYDAGGFKAKEQEKYYTGEVPESYILRCGDLLVAMTEQAHGLLGSSAIVPQGDLYLHNQRLGLVVDLDARVLDERFLYYLFNTPAVRSQIQATATGTKVRHTSPSRIGDVKVVLPPLSSQQQIAGILSAYDTLIENNTRRIAILEEMARAIYREWFVNFRFPGSEQEEMVKSKPAPVPAGWEGITLKDVCHLTMGQSPKSQHYNEERSGLPFHQGVSDFGPRFPTHRVYCTVASRTADEGDILFSVRAPVGRINIASTKLVLGRGLSAIRSKAGHQEFLFYQLRDLFQEEDSMGGGTIFKSVTKAEMLAIRLLAPPASLVERFERVVRAMSAQINNLTTRNAILRQTRDLLLPKLISGEIEVSVAEDALAGAGA